MKPEELIDGLDKYGADLARWPESQRLAAETFLRDGPGTAWKDWQSAKAVDAFLHAPVAPPSRELTDKIMLIPQTAKPAEMHMGWETIFAPFTLWPRRVVASAIAMSLVGGLWFGSVALPDQQTEAVTAANEAADTVTLDDMELDFL